MALAALILLLPISNVLSDTMLCEGGSHTCALKNGAVKCWGHNGFGELGLGSSSTKTPTDAVDLGVDFVPSSIHCGGYNTCVVSTAGGLKCFGFNEYGQLGYGDTTNRGTSSGHMGDNLPLVLLPSGFLALDVAPLLDSTCVLSTELEIVCFGRNSDGQLGIGNTDDIDEVAEMGDSLVVTDLGDFEAASLTPQERSVCALSSGGQVKCFGYNQHGQLGLGDTTNRGETILSMGDNLPVLDFGTGFIVQSFDCGGNHCCALSHNQQMVCHGVCYYGQCGTEVAWETVGGQENDMGDNLMTVDLGDSFIIREFECGEGTTCAISEDGRLKCFGSSYRGQIGLGDRDYYGDSAGEMGDNLPSLDMGSGIDSSAMHLLGGVMGHHNCMFEDSSFDLLAKCWGYNYYGQLGIGSSEQRIGDEDNEMGDYLPFIDFGTWPNVTTAVPTSIPTIPPSVSPTGPVCDAEDMTAVNWHDLLNNDEQDVSLLQSYAVDFDASTLSLTFKASVEYVGRSADGNFDDDFNLGTSYWIDFQSFSSIDGGIDSVGNCANRLSTDYTNLTFGQFWNYTVNPADLELVNTAERTAYPPSDWNLTASSCNVVEFERTFSWTEMTGCVDAEDNELIEVTETADTVQLEGTFYVELVSPYSMSSDAYYRTYPLLQQNFGILLNRQVDALASTGVQLFISTVMAYGRDDAGNYELTILVQSADYVKLGTDNAVTAISSPLEVSDIQTVSDCLVASSFTCGQIFTATIPAECSDDDNTVDLSGNYQFSFTPECQTDDNGADETACTVFKSTLDETSGKVVLDVDASFTDNCDVDLFNVTFGADLTFYEDDAFTEAVGDNSDPFVIGQDTIYGKVLVDIAVDETDTMYTFVDVSIENIYVCTAEDELSLDSDSGIGGCLSSDIDADGPYVVYGTGAVTEYLGETYDVTGNEATFSFLTFDTPRTTIYVHVQLLLTLETETGERRRMLLQADVEEGNAFRSFVGTASVQEGETTADPVGTDGAAQVYAGFIAAMFAVTAYVLG